MHSEHPGDPIHIEQLEIFAHVGVPDEERVSAQRLTFSITLWPARALQPLDDQIGRTVDYAAVCAETKKLAGERRDRLIETLADSVATRLLQVFEIERITVELRKFILPGVQFVSVTVTRNRPAR